MPRSARHTGAPKPVDWSVQKPRRGRPPESVLTQPLLDWNRGDEHARDQMLPLVYDELRRLNRSLF